jgi:hypothetical protein
MPERTALLLCEEGSARLSLRDDVTVDVVAIRGWRLRGR